MIPCTLGSHMLQMALRGCELVALAVKAEKLEGLHAPITVRMEAAKHD